MTTDEWQIGIAQFLEEIARGIRDGSVYAVEFSRDSKNTKFDRRFKVLVEPTENDDVPMGITEEEWALGNEEYLSYHDSLILFYQLK